MKDILRIKDLEVEILKYQKKINIIDKISFSLKEKETLCIVGESGCGKTFTALSIMGLMPKNARARGFIYYNKKNLLDLDEDNLRNLRGKEISMVFQDPLTSLNPVFTIFDQLEEIISAHTDLDKSTAKQMCIDILNQVRIPEPENKLYAYPHQLSGGQRQRILIAMAILLSPRIVILDEPTTALDVTIQAEILEMLRELKVKKNLSSIYITHDLSVVSEVGDRVIVMYSGIIVEQGPKNEVLNTPHHPYTKGLIESMPEFNKRGKKLTPIPGYVPSPEKRPEGCPFHPRCRYKKKICTKKRPMLKEISKQHMARCHLI
ncbi:ABC transporter ATP-binding protein [Desulfothermus okinawensis]